MTLLDSLLDAILRLDGEALIMHAGEKPYVVLNSASMSTFRGPLSWGQVELSSRPLTADAVLGMLSQMLSAEQSHALDDLGAIEQEIDAPGDSGERFVVTAARGGDDVWVEVRRRAKIVEAPAAPAEPQAAAPAPHEAAAVREPPVVVETAAEPEAEPVIEITTEAATADDVHEITIVDADLSGLSDEITDAPVFEIASTLTFTTQTEASRVPDEDEHEAGVFDIDADAGEPEAAEPEAAEQEATEPEATVDAVVAAAPPPDRIIELAVAEQQVGEIAEQQVAAIAQQRVTEVAEQRVAEIAGQKVTEAAAQRVAEIAGAKVTEAAAQHVAEIAGAKVTEAAAHHVAEIAGQKVTEAATQRVAEIAGQKVTEAATQRVAEIAGAKVTEAAAQRVAEIADQKVTDAAAQQVAEIAGQKVSEAAAQHVAEIAGQRVKEAAEQQVAEIAGERVREAADQKVAEIAGQRVTEVAQQKVGEVAEQRVAAAAEQRVAEIAGERVTEAAQQRVAEIAGQAVAEVASQKVAEAAEQRVAEIADQKVAEAAEQRVAEIAGRKVADAAEQHVAEIVGQKVTEFAEQKVAEIAERMFTELLAARKIAELAEQRVAELAEHKVAVAPSRPASPGTVPELGAGSVVVPHARPPFRLHQPPSPEASKEASLVELLRAASAHRASTVYAVVDNRPMMRVDGRISVVGTQAAVATGDVERFVFEFAPRDQLTDGATEWTCTVPDVGRVRCVTFHDYSGAGLILHLPTGDASTADELAIPAELQALSAEADGLVVVAGPRSSGKSTLLGAFVDLINRTRYDHVITIESQIRTVHEQRLSFISQREVRGDGDVIAAAARAALREGPDVLVIEDLRSPEALIVALDAARAGRLVFGSISAQTAPPAIQRLIDAFPADRRAQVRASLAGSLRAVIAQLLVPKSAGGRIAAREVLFSSPAVKKLVLDGAIDQLPIAIESGRGLGMRTMVDSLGVLVRDGVVDLADACAFAPDRGALISALHRDGIDVTGVERRA